jgi:hypothetical protein
MAAIGEQFPFHGFPAEEELAHALQAANKTPSANLPAPRRVSFGSDLSEPRRPQSAWNFHRARDYASVRQQA